MTTGLVRRARRQACSALAAAAAIAAALAVRPAPCAADTTARLRPGPERVVKVLEDIARTLKSTRYQHVTVVRPGSGEYSFDCSGMAEWVLRRGAPAALAAVGRSDGQRPLAVHYWKRIARVPPGARRGAWHRVEDVTRAGPGDVIAWKRPPWFPSKSTGHVAFILSKGQPSPGQVPGHLFLVADASRFRHERDSRAEGTTGFGTGIMLLATDPALQPVGYGWYGSQSLPEWVVPAEIVIGRPLR
jgi:hypothetical protein